MQEQKKTISGLIKPNLKHDNMEYAASADGDDVLDSDIETTQEIEEKEITAEELELLLEDEVDDQAAALNSAETDSQADEDNFLNENEREEEFGDNSTEVPLQKRK
ncbi:MAG: hypothetical protein ABI760_07505 [Ferruginibacter sp.]